MWDISVTTIYHTKDKIVFIFQKNESEHLSQTIESDQATGLEGTKIPDHFKKTLKLCYNTMLCFQF